MSGDSVGPLAASVHLSGTALKAEGDNGCFILTSSIAVSDGSTDCSLHLSSHV